MDNLSVTAEQLPFVMSSAITEKACWFNLWHFLIEASASEVLREVVPD